MKKFFTLTTLSALFAFGCLITGCEEDTTIEMEEPLGPEEARAALVDFERRHPFSSSACSGARSTARRPRGGTSPRACVW